MIDGAGRGEGVVQRDAPADPHRERSRPTRGLDSRSHHLPDTASTTDVVTLVSMLANGDTVDGAETLESILGGHVLEKWTRK
jgi:hypothetical protein